MKKSPKINDITRSAVCYSREERSYMEKMAKVPIKATFKKNPDTNEMEMVSTEYAEVSIETLELYWKGIVTKLQMLQSEGENKGVTLGSVLGF